MVNKVQIPTIGGLRKKITLGSVSTATTISGLEGQTLTLAQLALLLGTSTAPSSGTSTPAAGGSGSSGGASLVLGPGLSGGGPLVGSVSLRLNAVMPYLRRVQEGPRGRRGPPGQGSTGGGGSGSLTVTDGTHAVASVTQLTLVGAVVSGSTPNATATISGGGGSVVNNYIARRRVSEELRGRRGTPGAAGANGSSGGGGSSVSITLSGGSTVLDASIASLYLITLTANSVVTFAGATAGADTEMLLIITQASGGSHTITWPTTGWPGSNTPTLTTVTGHSDIVKLSCGDGTNWFGYQAATDVYAPAAPGSYDAQVLVDNPVAYWKLQEVSGTSAADSGPNGLTGTYMGTPGTNYTLGEPPIAAGLGTSVLFNQTVYGYVNIPHNSLFDLSSGSYSMELWINIVVTSGNGEPLAKYGSGDAYRFVFLGTSLYMFINGSAALISSSVFSPGTVYHLVYVSDTAGGNSYLYVNGVLDTTVSGNTSPSANGSDLTIGVAGGPVAAANDYISNVALYNTALSSARVAAHYAAGI